MTETKALTLAVELAAQGAGAVLPGAVAGCVILDDSGEVVGQGWHQRAGGPHAEVHALADAGERARGATAVVTLEPCNHTGRTGPCSLALIEAGVRRVVYAVPDPWETAAGGAATLRAAGIETELTPSSDAEWVNRVWLTTVRLGRPYVTFKAGVTADGRVAAVDGTSRWITSPQSRAEVHDLRGRVDTMMVGIGTVLADDPWLTVRDADGVLIGRQPLRVVVDSAGRTPSTAKVLDDAAATLIATAADFGNGERVDLAALLTALGAQGRHHLLLEGGPRLAAAMIDADLVDEMLLYTAPLVLGAGPSALAGSTVATLDQARRARLVGLRQVGPDALLHYSFRD